MEPTSSSLNHHQFAQQINAAGGASRRLSDGTPPPARGFMVSHDPSSGHEHKVDGPATAVAAASHFSASSIRRSAPKSAYQGGWHNNDDGKTYYDVSDHVPNMSEAINRGVSNKQLAIHDLSRGADIHLSADGVNHPSPRATEIFTPKARAHVRVRATSPGERASGGGAWKYT